MQSSIFARPISCASNYSHKWKLNKCSYFQDLIFAVTIKSAETSTKCLFLLSCLLCFLWGGGGRWGFCIVNETENENKNNSQVYCALEKNRHFTEYNKNVLYTTWVCQHYVALHLYTWCEAYTVWIREEHTMKKSISMYNGGEIEKPAKKKYAIFGAAIISWTQALLLLLFMCTHHLRVSYHIPLKMLWTFLLALHLIHSSTVCKLYCKYYVSI